MMGGGGVLIFFVTTSIFIIVSARGQDLNCDFEKDFCHWTQVTTNEIKWLRQKENKTLSVGPAVDHTTGNHCINIETSSEKKGDVSQLVSAVIPPTLQTLCFNFEYIMSGKDIGTLNFYVQYGLSTTLMWTLSDDQTTTWTAGSFSLPQASITHNSQIVIEYISGSGQKGYIKLDNLELGTSSCSVTPSNAWPTESAAMSQTTAPQLQNGFPINASVIEAVTHTSHAGGTDLNDISLTGGHYLYSGGFFPAEPPSNLIQSVKSGTNFTCSDGGCVEADSVCNFILDCRDGSDEAMCGTCDFEHSLCGWHDISTGITFWSNKSASVASGLQPTSDVTLPSGSAGHYMIVGKKLSGSPNAAVLVSPVLSATGASCHMVFSYFMMGFGSGNLSIGLQNVNDTGTYKYIQLWSTVRQNSSNWTQTSIDIGSIPAGMQILIISTEDDPSADAVAVDDILFIQCQQNDLFNTLDCSFTDSNLCGYYQSLTDNFDWTLGTGPIPSFQTGPAGDHTTGTGSFVYIETSAPHKPGDKAVLMSALMPPIGGDMCIRFWYHMFGLHIETLNVYLVTGPSFANYTRIWSRSASQGNTWRQGEAPVSSNRIWQIAFEGVVGLSYSGDIALDDIHISMEKCPPQVVCDFESDQCGYTQPRTETFRWTRSSNLFNAWGTHPSSDHTTRNGNGFYMLIDASVAESGESARMLSPEITVTKSVFHCVYFWYHMIGENVGQLNVYASTDDFGDKLIWSNSQSRGDYWTQGRATIGNNLGNFHVKFEGVVWSGFEGDMALDDIRIVEGACPHIGSCDFEYDMCGFFNPYDVDMYEWLRNSGDTSSDNGPHVDHTTNTDKGFYIYTDVNNQQAGNRAWLYSDFIPLTNSSCVEFWYYMHGQDVGTLLLFLVQVNNVSKVLWQHSGNQGNQWKLAQVNLSSLVEYQEGEVSDWAASHLYGLVAACFCDGDIDGSSGVCALYPRNCTKYLMIAFDGESTGLNGNFAIDDIHVTDGACVNFAPTPPADVIASSSVAYISSNWDCNFDSNTLCTWIQDTSDTIDWRLQKGATDTNGTGPSSDHTTGKDYYIYTESSYRYQNDTARIISSPLTLSMYGACLKFWYNMYGSDIGTINFYIRQEGKLGTPLWMRTGEQSKNWLAGNVFITSNSNVGIHVQMVFEAMLNVGFKSDIALDDISLTNGSCVEIGGSCDFESENICGFTQDLTDDFDWTRNSGSTKNNGTGPRNDHTYGTRTGFYMYTEASSIQSFGDKARLISPILKATDGKCLRFFYHMRGGNMGTLNIYQMLNSQLHTPIWTTSGEQPDKWLPAQVTLISPLDFQIVFEGILGGTSTSNIAIDDISFIQGPCLSPATCDFETDSCLFTNAGDDNFDWDIYQGSTTIYGGPRTDHTLQTSLGHYMLADTHDKIKGDRARLFSEVLPPTTASCLIFSVAMSRISSGSVLSVNLDTDLTGNGHFDNKRTFSDPQYTSWLPGTIDIVSAVPYSIVFDVLVGTPGKSDIAIDDVMLSPGKCPQRPDKFDCGNGQSISINQTCDYHQDCTNNADEAHCGNCNFETDLCGFVDVSKGSIAWKQATDADADDVGTRIGADHTLKTISGHFMYVTSQRGNTYSANAILSTPELRPTFETCQFQFYYKKTAGTLQVYIEIGSRDVLIWETQNQVSGSAWARALVSIGHYNSRIKLLIQATRSYASSTTVAIDDTRFFNCGLPPASATCQSNQLQCANHVCYNKIFKCDLTDDCGDGTDESDCASATQCNFEKGLCSWTQDTTDDLNWTLNAGKTITPNTGPNVDHSTGLDTGFYMYLETSAPAKAGQRARLLSPVINPAQVSDDCHMSFFYHMYGDSMGPLNIYIATERAGYPTLLFTRQIYDQYFWAREVLPLNSTKNFQVIFEGIVGQSFYGDMAIDDISFSAGCKLASAGTSLPAPGYSVTTQSATTTRCLTSQFQCSSGQCIASSKVCDFLSDCTDGSEEVVCGTCTFENGMCGWSYVSTGHFRWSLSSESVMGIVGPAADSKPGNSTGHYVFIEPDFGITSGPSILRSRPLGAISTACVMTFSYHLSSGNISVYVPIEGVKTRIWSSQNVVGSVWNKAYVYIGRNIGISQLPQGTQIEIRYNATGSSVSRDIASIDDIFFVACNPRQTSPVLACNFENKNTCNWAQSSSDIFDWTLQSGRTASGGTGPSSAHGGIEYIYAEASFPRQANDTADLMSPTLTPTALIGYCLSFWYHMHGSEMGSLQLISRYPTSDSILWSQSSTQKDTWIQQNVFINMSQDYTLIFRATIGSGYLSDIALDDISTRFGGCPTLPYCTFDSGFCGFTQETNDTFDWSLGSGSTQSAGTGPSSDHTSGSSVGKYAYIEASGRKLNDNAIITSTIYNGQNSRQGCLTFWYHMYGAGMGTLNVYRRDQGSAYGVQLWRLQGSQENMWKKALVNVNAQNKPYRIQFEGIVGRSFQSDIAIDDFEINLGTCPPLASCNFEDGLCGFINVEQGDKFDWILDSAGTESSNTGPQVDHTKGTTNGQYIYIETSGTHSLGDNALLQSEPIPATNGSCLQFWYHMYGATIGTLNVYTKNISSSARKTEWTLSGNQGNLWKQGRVQLQSLQTFEFGFEGTYGGDYTGDIAIDDILFSIYPCVSTSLNPVSPTSPLPVSYPPSSLDCDFENHFCLWTQDKTDDLDWRWQAGPTSTLGTGPPSDHTLGNTNGHYIYTEVSNIANNSSARLISPPVSIPKATGICFKFWYYMYGANINHLNIYVTSSLDGQSILLWSKVGTQGPEWKYAQIHIQDVSGSANITVEAISGSGPTGDIAVDDFSKNDGTCPQQSECGFENDNLCAYTQLQTDDFDWIINTASTNTSYTGPVADHTFNTPEGHYAYIESSSPRRIGDKARLQTNLFNPTVSSCLTFWYSMNGETMGTLNVLQQSGGVSDSSANQIWSLSGPQGSDWQLAQISVTSSLPYYIIFEGVVGSGIYSDMAIDDIKVVNGLCPGLGSCDFEEATCSWTNTETGDDFDWMRGKGARRYANSGVKVDHTLNTAYGGYLLMDSAAPRRTNEHASLISPRLKSNGTYCLNFWYYMNSGIAGVGTLSAKLVSQANGSSTNLWSSGNDTINKWMLQRLSVGPTTSDFNLVLDGKVGQPSFSDIALDDLAIQIETCESNPQPDQTKNAFLCTADNKYVTLAQKCNFHNDCSDGQEEKACGYNCDFDSQTFSNNTCMWVNVSGHSYSWALNRGATPNANTGPSVDHTTGTPAGYYLYVDSNKGTYNTATLQSPLLSRSSPTCELMFFFHMTGSNIGTLSVEKQQGTQTYTLWFTNIDHGNSWQRQIIPLGRSEAPFVVSFNAKRSYTVKGDIAIDDITFRNCDFPQPLTSCTGRNTFKCNNAACVDPILQCNIADDCGDNSDEDPKACSAYHQCTFEVDMCDWTQENYLDEFDWSLGVHGTPSQDTGPSVDHTTSLPSGHFFYIETSSPRMPGDKAWLLSPIFNPTSLCLMNIFINMFGADIDVLWVYTRTVINGQLSSDFTVSGNKGNFWQQKTIYLSSSLPFQVIIEAVRGNGPYGDIAIDDISFSPDCVVTNASLATEAPTTEVTSFNPCSDSGKWLCRDLSNCIPLAQACDFIFQCTDQSDELNCGACTFEVSACGWSDRSPSMYYWDRTNTASQDALYKPKSDHTLGPSGIGWYMIVRSTDAGYASSAYLEGPVLGATEEGCDLTFYYQMGNSGTMYLFLYPNGITKYTRDTGTRLWSSSFYSRTGWTLATVGIGAKAAGFKLVFEYRSTSPLQSTGVAIDDVSYGKSCMRGSVNDTCPAGDFRCLSTGECKTKDVLCDLAKDCLNGEDESSSQCLNYERCNFEKGTCRWVQDDNDDFDWTLNSGRTSSIDTGPDFDHTYGNETGHYMYIEPSSHQLPNDIARLKSPVFFPNIQGTCFIRFFYHMRGYHINSLNVYTETKENGSLSLKWSMKNAQGDEWKRANVKIDNTQNFRVVIEGVRGFGYNGDIAVDDISFTSDCYRLDYVTLPPLRPTVNPGICKAGTEFQCDNNKCKSVQVMCDFNADCLDGTDEKGCPAVCNFENGMCGWSDQTRLSGSGKVWNVNTSSAFSDVDMTPGTNMGHVLVGTGWRPILVSPFFNRASKLCVFSFSYKTNKYPRSITLSIRAGGFDNQLWQLQLSSSVPYTLTEWQTADVKLPGCVSEFQMVISVNFGYSTGSYLLLDNLVFANCGSPPQRQCSVKEWQCSDGECITPDQRCDLNIDCCDNSDENDPVCYYYSKNTFENGMGDWKNIAGGTNSWSVNQGSLPFDSNFLPTPTTDHTTHSRYGHCLSVSMINQLKNASSGISYEMSKPKSSCDIGLWYLMSDINIGIINIYTVTASSVKVLQDTLSPSNKTNVWLKHVVPAITISEPFTLQIETCSGVSASGYFAIDDVTFSPSCNVPVPATPAPLSTSQPTAQTFTFRPCDNNQFQCTSSGACIAQKSVCDFHRDCTDGSDESQCDTTTLCNFDTGLCTWYEANADKLDWEQGLAASMPSDKGPSIDGDHAYGGYAYIDDRNNGNTIGQLAVLKSNSYASSSAGCTLRFSYYIAGSGAGTLSLKINTSITTGQILWQTSQQTKNWANAVVGIGRRRAPFTLAFSRAAATSYSGQIALDNFKFSLCTEPEPVSQGSCITNQFQCGTAACIDNSLVCNKDDDCGDSSDENITSCSSFTFCDFETSFGNFSQSTEDQLDWQRWDKSQTIAPGLQGVDHSTGFNSGHYIFVTGGTTTDQAWLLSKVFNATDSCLIRFFAIIPSSNQKIEVSIRNHSKGQLDRVLNMADPAPGTYWQQMVVSVASSQPFQLIFQAQPGGPGGAVAIDDITLSSGCKYTNTTLPVLPVTFSTVQFTTSTSDGKCIDQNCADSSNLKSSSSWQIPVAVVLGILGAVGVICGIFIFLKKTNRLGKIPFRRLGKDTHAMEGDSSANPVYDSGSEETSLQQVEPSVFEPSNLLDVSVCVDNSLYQDDKTET